MGKFTQTIKIISQPRPKSYPWSKLGAFQERLINPQVHPALSASKLDQEISKVQTQLVQSLRKAPGSHGSSMGLWPRKGSQPNPQKGEAAWNSSKSPSYMPFLTPFLVGRVPLLKYTTEKRRRKKTSGTLLNYPLYWRT